MFDLNRYYDRIGLQAVPTLASIHRAHATSIPFENLDPVRGLPNSLDPDVLEDKLVVRRRGGYCFEQNLLLLTALRAAGLGTVTPILARTRVRAHAGPRPRTHLLLRVEIGDVTWHADVGFGSDGLVDPIPFGAGGVYAQDGWDYRVVDDGPELVLQMRRGDRFADLYGFVPEPALGVDIEVSNWYVCTHPRSPFTTGLYLSAQRDGRRTILLERDGEVTLVEKTPTSYAERAVPIDEVGNIVEAGFGLPRLRRTRGGWDLADAS